MNDRIYLDHAATCPLDPLVAEAMLPWTSGTQFGNPSSIHSFGRAARNAVDEARDSVAKLIGADYSDIYFTASGTESDNLALLGVMLESPPERNELIVSAIEALSCPQKYASRSATIRLRNRSTPNQRVKFCASSIVKTIK